MSIFKNTTIGNLSSKSADYRIRGREIFARVKKCYHQIRVVDLKFRETGVIVLCNSLVIVN